MAGPEAGAGPWAIMRPVQGRIRFAMALAVLGSLLGLGAMAFMALAFDRLIDQPSVWPWRPALGALACTIGAYLLRLAAFNRSHFAAFSLETVLRMQLGDAAARLSGGERQHMLIARALLKDAPIVVLDEPTAALDTESELAVQAALDALVRDKTVIVIAHRLSTIVGADRILVLDGGRLVEQVSHLQLLARRGRYWRLWEAQLRAKCWQPTAASGHISPAAV